MSMFVLSGFLVGLVGSLHCLGMCGPIALALPMSGNTRLRFYAGRFVYNLGRVVTYALMGAVFGVIGRTVAVAGFQQTMSVVAGAFIIVFALVPFGYVARLLPSLTGGLVGRVQAWWGSLFSRSSMTGMFGIGLLNGLLPCGLVYVALGAAVVTGSILDASAYMALFGLGTVPAMFVAASAGSLLRPSIRHKLARILPVAAVVLGTLLILRGLSLGIPYISPDMDRIVLEEPACCH